MDKPEVESLTFEHALAMAIGHNTLLGEILDEQRKLARIKALERLVVHRDGEVWELEVEDSMPADDGWSIHLMGRARRIK